jgi:hypothetical protein
MPFKRRGSTAAETVAGVPPAARSCRYPHWQSRQPLQQGQQAATAPSSRGGRRSCRSPPSRAGTRSAENPPASFANRLLDDARAGKADQSAGLGNHHIADKGEGCRHPAHRRVAQNRDERQLGLRKQVKMAVVLAICISEKRPSCMRAPPDAVTQMKGRRCSTRFARHARSARPAPSPSNRP